MCESCNTHNVAITIHLHDDVVANILQLHVTKRLLSYKNRQILESNTEKKKSITKILNSQGQHFKSVKPPAQSALLLRHISLSGVFID